MTKASAVSDSAEMKNYIIISYEDKEGNVYEKKQDIEVHITAPVYKDLERVKENKNYSGVMKKAAKIIILIVLILGAIMLWIRRKRRKQQILDEFVK